MSNTEKELKACPFCGSHAEEHTPKSGDYQDDPDVQPTYSCSAHGCMASHYCMDLVDWNTRPASPLAEENKRLMEAAEEALKLSRIWIQNNVMGSAHFNMGSAIQRILEPALADTVAQQKEGA